MSRISTNPRLDFPDGDRLKIPALTYREYLIANIAQGALIAKYHNSARADLLAPQIIEIADRIIKELEKENA